jgi:hypothetical protein
MSSRLSRLALALAVALAALASLAAGAKEIARTPDEKKTVRTPDERKIDKGAPRVQIALLLDNSGSMSGLINQARTELWTIVGALANAQRDGVPAEVEVALYSYGDPPAKQLVPFTTDLDVVSEALFSLGISGGSEHCGEAIDIAHKNLAWTGNRKDLQLVFIAGNEEFTQGPVKFTDAIKRAQDPGIVVSTIHCGGAGPEADQWRDAAALSSGAFANIDIGRAVAHVDTPFDKEIADLGVALNETYIPYGAHGASGSARQKAQDSNALGSSLGTGTRRSLAKASGLYSNSTWDLVDAVREKKVDLANAGPEGMPAAMRGMNAEERAKYVAEMQAKRDTIKKKIGELNVKRQQFLAQHEKEQGADGSLDRAIIKAVEKLAADKGFTLASSQTAMKATK